MLGAQPYRDGQALRASVAPLVFGALEESEMFTAGVARYADAQGAQVALRELCRQRIEGRPAR